MPAAYRYSDGRWYRFVGDNAVVMSEKERVAGDHLGYTLRVTNWGKTPAFILNYEIYWFGIDKPKALITSGESFRFAGGGGFIDLTAFNIFEYSRYISFEKRAYLVITVNYQHVFDKQYTGTEVVVYAFSTRSDSLHRVEGVPPIADEKQGDEATQDQKAE